MSLLFDAVGHWAVGHAPDTGATILAGTGIFSLIGEPATFTISEVASFGSFTLTGEAITFATSLLVSYGIFTLVGPGVNLIQSNVTTRGAAPVMVRIRVIPKI